MVLRADKVEGDSPSCEGLCYGGRCLPKDGSVLVLYGSWKGLPNKITKDVFLRASLYQMSIVDVVEDGTCHERTVGDYAEFFDLKRLSL